MKRLFKVFFVTLIMFSFALQGTGLNSILYAKEAHTDTLRPVMTVLERVLENIPADAFRLIKDENSL